ncbi:MAG: hypothetical protein QXU98_12350, partial [Candidatus Parvarchaeota archaeon]
MHSAGAFTLNIHSGNVNYDGYYWSYDSNYETSSSQTTWSAEVDTGNSAYSANGHLNEYFEWNWGDGTYSQLDISTGATGLNSYSGTVLINDYSYPVSNGQLTNYPYTTAPANPSGFSCGGGGSAVNDAPTAFYS